MGFGLDKTLGRFSGRVDNVVFARGASWSDKDEFFWSLFGGVVSEIGTSGVDLEEAVMDFLWDFEVGVVMENRVRVVLVSTKEMWMTEERDVAIRGGEWKWNQTVVDICFRTLSHFSK